MPKRSLGDTESSDPEAIEVTVTALASALEELQRVDRPDPKLMLLVSPITGIAKQSQTASVG